MSVPMLVTICNKALVSLADYMVPSTEADASCVLLSIYSVAACLLHSLTLISDYNIVQRTQKHVPLLMQQCAAAVIFVPKCWFNTAL